MTKDFYTNVQVFGNKILYRGIKNGERIQDKLDYAPSFFSDQEMNQSLKLCMEKI